LLKTKRLVKQIGLLSKLQACLIYVKVKMITTSTSHTE